VNISSAEFLSSVTAVENCPKPDWPEYAFIGRSNVGKSSLINMILIKKGLAKTSSTPGKTQTINHFVINGPAKPWYLVDLPGYGYAKTAKSKREKWERFVRYYLVHRENLLCTFVLIDIRLKPQAGDMEFMEWMGTKGIPFQMVFTKCDKLSVGQIEARFAEYQEKMLEVWEEMPGYFLSSAENRLGREKILNLIDDLNREYAGIPKVKSRDL